MDGLDAFRAHFLPLSPFFPSKLWAAFFLPSSASAATTRGDLQHQLPSSLKRRQWDRKPQTCRNSCRLRGLPSQTSLAEEMSS